MKKESTALTTVIRSNANLASVNVQYSNATWYCNKALRTNTYKGRTWTDETGEKHFTDSAWNRKADNMIIGADASSFEDLVQDVIERVTFLHKYCAVDTETEMFTFRTFLYRAVNRNQTKWKRHDSQVTAYETKTEEGDSIFIGDKTIDNALMSIEKEGGLDTLYAICDAIVSERTDRDLLKACFCGMVNDEMQKDIAKKCKCGITQVARVQGYIRNALNTPDVWEYLHMCVYDDYSGMRVRYCTTKAK